MDESIDIPTEATEEKSRDGSVYEDPDLDELPEWWRSAIAEFHAHDLPPYQPPRFSDGVLIQEIIDKLRGEYDQRIALIGMDTRYGDDWTVRIGEEAVGEIRHGRASEGYVVFGMESEEFEEWIDDEIQKSSD